MPLSQEGFVKEEERDVLTCKGMEMKIVYNLTCASLNV